MYAGISIPNSPAVRSSWRRKKSVIHSRNTFFSRFSDRSPIFLFITSSVLHVRRNLNPQQSRRPLQLAAEEIRHPQQKHFLLAVFRSESYLSLHNFLRPTCTPESQSPTVPPSAPVGGGRNPSSTAETLSSRGFLRGDRK